ncbi:MAG: site-specific integrase [Chlorobiaceae bacterium]|nr:site-specific integrase [Chlorobiaceae bacterium]
MKATLRKRLIDNGTRYSLRLDIYPPAPHPETGKLTRFVNLGMSLHVDPKTKEARLENKETMALANATLTKTQLQLHAGRYDFLITNKPTDFIEFYKKHTLERNISLSTKGKWKISLRKLQAFLMLKPDQPLYFSEIDKNLLENFRTYLLQTSMINTAQSDFSNIRTALNHAYRNDMMKVKITEQVKAIQPQRTKIIYLTKEELNKLVKTPCGKPLIKRAALFAALTGMRISDVANLRWEDFVFEPTGPCVHFRQRKTKALNYLPVSQQAIKIAAAMDADDNQNGNPKDKPADIPAEKRTGVVFPRLIELHTQCKRPHFKIWIRDAGIKKNVTFHTMRHTFATLQLLANTNIKTLSEMLGHTKIENTMIYAHVVNASRRAAADVITIPAEGE